MILTLLAGCAMGIAVAYFAERPFALSVGSITGPDTLLIRGSFGSVDTIGHQVLFNAIDPYTQSHTLPLLIRYDTDTRIFAGVRDRQTGGYKSRPSTGDEIKPGEAGYVIVNRRSGSLYAFSIFDTGMKETDL